MAVGSGLEFLFSLSLYLRFLGLWSYLLDKIAFVAAWHMTYIVSSILFSH